MTSVYVSLITFFINLPKHPSGASLYALSKLYFFPLVLWAPYLRLCIALFAVAEGD